MLSRYAPGGRAAKSPLWSYDPLLVCGSVQIRNIVLCREGLSGIVVIDVYVGVYLPGISSVELQALFIRLIDSVECQAVTSAEVNSFSEQISGSLGLWICERVVRSAGPEDHLVALVSELRQMLYELFLDTNEEKWQRIFDINSKAPAMLTREILPHMISKQSGSILNVSSVWGETGASMEVAYSASKAALIGFSKALAKEVGLSGITVNSVSPGVILTDMTSHFDEDTMNSLKEETPLYRIGTPDDVAGAVSFLASKDADFITGQNISVNGGMNI